jgi:hypothetical protein
LQQLVEQIAARIGKALERSGLVERDLENAWLAADTEAGPLDDLLGHSITYRIAVGPRAGQKLFTLQTVAPRPQGLEAEPNGAARVGGFSLHAGVGIVSNQRERLERLCRDVSRPPVASERLALTASGQVRYTLKTPYRDGTTHIVLEPLDLMARLAALVPTPRMHLTRYHGVFAPHSRYRAAVTPAQRGRGAAPPPVSGNALMHDLATRQAVRWSTRVERLWRHDGAWQLQTSRGAVDGVDAVMVAFDARLIEAAQETLKLVLPPWSAVTCHRWRYARSGAKGSRALWDPARRPARIRTRHHE